MGNCLFIRHGRYTILPELGPDALTSRRVLVQLLLVNMLAIYPRMLLVPRNGMVPMKILLILNVRPVVLGPLANGLGEMAVT